MLKKQLSIRHFLKIQNRIDNTTEMIMHVVRGK